MSHLQEEFEKLFPLDIETQTIQAVKVGRIYLNNGSSIQLHLTPSGLSASVIIRGDGRDVHIVPAETREQVYFVQEKRNV